MLDVAVYARVSTDEQAEHGYSLESQINNCQKRALEEGAESVTVYVDPAESSVTLDRPALTSMRLAIEKGQHNCVIAYDQDRLSRNTIESLILRDEILSSGCQLIFLNGGPTTQSPDDLMLYGFKALMAEAERIKIRARTMEGRRTKAAKGIMPVKFRLYGYSHDTEADKISVNEQQAQWVRKMFEWCAREHVSAWIIARRLAAADAPSPSGKGWYKESVARLLHNEAFAGTAHFHKWDEKNHWRKRPREEWVPISVPAIVSQELWDAAQSTLVENRTRTSKHNVHHDALLRGLLKCGHCGRGMRTFISPGTRHIPRYYCNPTARFQPGDPGKAMAAKQCPGSSVRMQVIDPLLWGWAEDFLANPEAVLAFGPVETDDTSALDEEIAVLEGALARCGDTRHGILDFYASRLIGKDEAEKRLAAIRKDEIVFQRRLKEARTMLQAKPVPDDALERVACIREALETADVLTVQQKNQILREIIDFIEVWPDADFSKAPVLKVHLHLGSLVTASMVQS